MGATHQRAVVAITTRNVKRGAATGDQLDEAKRDLAAANLETYIERIVAAAPPLTDAQRARLARILLADSPPAAASAS